MVINCYSTLKELRTLDIFLERVNLLAGVGLVAIIMSLLTVSDSVHAH